MFPRSPVVKYEEFTGGDFFMDFKRRKSKVSYTLMIISDSAGKHTRRLHLKAKAAGILSAAFFLVCVALVCYVVYSSITLSDSLERSKRQMEQINRMKAENETLENANDELTKKVSILSDTVNQKVEAEEALAAKKEEEHLPKGFPLSGSAQIRTEDAAADAGEQDEEDGQAAFTADTDSKEIIFTASEGINVTASGAGTVISVDADTGYGSFVGIDHGNGYVSTYRNRGQAVVKAGDTVERGAVLFVVGEDNTELGYRIQKDGAYMDPMEMIEING